MHPMHTHIHLCQWRRVARCVAVVAVVTEKLDLGELVTIPPLHDNEEWIRFESTRRVLSQRFGNSRASTPVQDRDVASPARVTSWDQTGEASRTLAQK